MQGFIINARRGSGAGRRAALRRAVLGAASLTTLTVAAPGAFAQDAEDGYRDAQDVMTVTARRREENLQDVPISVSAFSGEKLQDLGAQDLTVIQQITPNTTVEVSRGTNTTITTFIRGVGQQDPVAGFEQGVGIYIDDVYLNRPQAAVLDIYDVERVEVLRGPQGTLYGRNTIGGAIKYVTKRLNPDELEAKVRGTYGSYGQRDVVATISVPLTDTLRIGGTGAVFTRNGFGENVVQTGVDNYDKEVVAGRVSLEWEPTDAVFFRVAADITNDDSSPRQGHRLIPDLAPPFEYPVLDDVFDTRAGLTFPQQEVESRGVSVLGEWQVNEYLKVKNVFAYRDDESGTPIDFDSLPEADLDVPAIYENDQLSEELQLLFESDRLAGVLGFYFLEANASTVFDVLLFTSLAGLNAQTAGDVNTTTWSVFGDFTYDVTDQISVSVGGRFTSDDRDSTILRRTLVSGPSSTFDGPPEVVLATTSDFQGSERFTDFSPRASISWRPTDEHNLYVSYSQGFKGGSFDPRCQSTSAPDLDGDGTPGALDFDDQFEFCQFDPEEIDTYEIGLKSNTFGGRLNTAVAFFYSDYKDVQIPGSVGVTDPVTGLQTFTGVTTNAASADIFGVEFEAQATIFEDFLTAGDSLRTTAVVGWLDAEFNEFIGPAGDDVADQRVFQNTPEWSSNITSVYSHPLALAGREGDLSISGSASYRSLTSQFEQPNAFLDQPEYVLLDLALNWRSQDGRYRVALNATNVLDKEYIVAGYNFVADTPAGLVPTLGTEGTLTAFYGNPRQVFGTIEVAF